MPPWPPMSSLPPQDHRTGAPVSPGGIDTASMADNNRRRSLGLLGTNALQNALSAFVPPKLAGSGATPPAPAPAPEGLALGAQKPPRPVRRASLVSGVRCVWLKGTPAAARGDPSDRSHPP